MDRTFDVILPVPVLIPGTAGGHRLHVIIRATEPAEAERLYWQQFPNGPVPSAVEER